MQRFKSVKQAQKVVGAYVWQFTKMIFSAIVVL